MWYPEPSQEVKRTCSLLGASFTIRLTFFLCTEGCFPNSAPFCHRLYWNWNEIKINLLLVLCLGSHHMLHSLGKSVKIGICHRMAWFQPGVLDERHHDGSSRWWRGWQQCWGVLLSGWDTGRPVNTGAALLTAGSGLPSYGGSLLVFT